MLAQAFARLGHEVIVVVDRSDALHRPEHYQGSIPPGIKIIEHKHANSSKVILDFVLPWRARSTLPKECHYADFYITTGFWGVIAAQTKSPYFVLLTGSDLEYGAEPKKIFINYLNNTQGWKGIRLLKALVASIAGFNQRQSIKKAIGFNYFPKGIIKKGDELLKRIGYATEQRFSFMVTDTSKREYVAPKNNSELVVLLAARQTWINSNQAVQSLLDNKGTDIFLRGIAHFIDHHPDRKISIILVEKGENTNESKALIKELNIGDCIVWKQQMSQKVLFSLYAEVDVVADHFSPSSVVGMAGLDALAMGKPLLAHSRSDIFEPLIGEKSPICHAENPQQVSDWLLKLTDFNVRNVISVQSRAYVEKYFSTDSAATQILKRYGELGSSNA